MRFIFTFLCLAFARGATAQWDNGYTLTWSPASQILGTRSVKPAWETFGRPSSNFVGAPVVSWYTAPPAKTTTTISSAPSLSYSTEMFSSPQVLKKATSTGTIASVSSVPAVQAIKKLITSAPVALSNSGPSYTITTPVQSIPSVAVAQEINGISSSLPITSFSSVASSVPVARITSAPTAQAINSVQTLKSVSTTAPVAHISTLASSRPAAELFSPPSSTHIINSVPMSVPSPSFSNIAVPNTRTLVSKSIPLSPFSSAPAMQTIKSVPTAAPGAILSSAPITQAAKGVSMSASVAPFSMLAYSTPVATYSSVPVTRSIKSIATSVPSTTFSNLAFANPGLSVQYSVPPAALSSVQNACSHPVSSLSSQSLTASSQSVSAVPLSAVPVSTLTSISSPEFVSHKSSSPTISVAKLIPGVSVIEKNLITELSPVVSSAVEHITGPLISTLVKQISTPITISLAQELAPVLHSNIVSIFESHLSKNILSVPGKTQVTGVPSGNNLSGESVITDGIISGDPWLTNRVRSSVFQGVSNPSHAFNQDIVAERFEPLVHIIAHQIQSLSPVIQQQIIEQTLPIIQQVIPTVIKTIQTSL